MTKPNMSIKDRFNIYVDASNKDGCWIWIGARQRRDRYGTFGIDGKMYLSHRVSYQIHKGEIPQGMHVLHTCDVPYCVNPDHLFLGSHHDNMTDKENKGRGKQAKGECSGNAKLTEDNVRDILASTEMYKSLAAKYGVSIGLIGHIRNRRAWKHVN